MGKVKSQGTDGKATAIHRVNEVAQARREAAGWGDKHSDSGSILKAYHQASSLTFCLAAANPKTRKCESLLHN